MSVESVIEFARVFLLPILLAVIVVIINNVRIDRADKENMKKQAALFMTRLNFVINEVDPLQKSLSKYHQLKAELKLLDDTTDDFYALQDKADMFLENEVHRNYKQFYEKMKELNDTTIDKLPVKVYQKCVFITESKRNVNFNNIETLKQKMNDAVSELEKII